jgi:hypothetical protein
MAKSYSGKYCSVSEDVLKQNTKSLEIYLVTSLKLCFRIPKSLGASLRLDSVMYNSSAGHVSETSVESRLNLSSNKRTQPAYFVPMDSRFRAFFLWHIFFLKFGALNTSPSFKDKNKEFPKRTGFFQRRRTLKCLVQSGTDLTAQVKSARPCTRKFLFLQTV